MANGKIAKAHPDAYKSDAKDSLDQTWDKLAREMKITKWVAIIWVSIYFVLACIFVPYLLVTFLPVLF